MRDNKIYFTAALASLLTLGFIATSIISYFVAQESLGNQISEESLPLTSDNIYSEIERDLLRSVLISSLMANDTFVRDWSLGGELDPEAIVRYLRQIQETYTTTTAFFVSEQTRRYYHSSGLLGEVDPDDPGDAWYFRVRELRDAYEINIDADTADRTRVTIFVNYRVNDYDGRYIGVTGVGLSVDTVAQLIDRYQQRYGRSIFFVDRDGDVTLRGALRNDAAAPGQGHLRELAGLQQVATQVLTSPSASLRYTAPSGETVYLNSRLIPELDWYLIVEQVGSSSGARILNALSINIATGLGITTLVLISAYFTVRGYQFQLEEMATKDKLTGGANRQVFDTLFEHAVRTAKRRESPLSMITIDIDEFKPVNDGYGHAAGDAVMRALSHLIRNHIRESDTLCRWGGDEFLVLLEDCDLEMARKIAEAIRQAVRNHTVRHGGQAVRVTVSLGVAQHRPGESMDTLLARCDAALYTSKTQGRDLVTTA